MDKQQLLTRDLISCPHCGGTALLIKSLVETFYGRCLAGCLETDTYPTPEEAALHWNARHYEIPPQQRPQQQPGPQRPPSCARCLQAPRPPDFAAPASAAVGEVAISHGPGTMPRLSSK